MGRWSEQFYRLKFHSSSEQTHVHTQVCLDPGEIDIYVEVCTKTKILEIMGEISDGGRPWGEKDYCCMRIQTPCCVLGLVFSLHGHLTEMCESYFSPLLLFLCYNWLNRKTKCILAHT